MGELGKKKIYYINNPTKKKANSFYFILFIYLSTKLRDCAHLMICDSFIRIINFLI